MDSFCWQIGVDLGSSNILVYVRDKGIVIDEPALLARRKKKRWTGLSAPSARGGEVVAIGYRAKEILSREPREIEVVAPIKSGIISDLEAAEVMISHYLKLVGEIPAKRPKWRKIQVIAGVPWSITEVQKRAVRSVFRAAGAGEVILAEGGVLAALGVGLPVDSSSGLMVIDVGGGKTEVNVVSMGGVVVGGGIRTAGDDLTVAIINYIKLKHGLLIGFNTAEKIKIEVGNLSDGGRANADGQKSMVVRGRDLESGLPKSVRISGAEVMEATGLEVSKILSLVAGVLDETPPELMEDILKKGLVLVGGGARLKGLDRVVERETRISCRLAEDPEMAVAKGLGVLLDNPGLRQSLVLPAL